MKCLVSKNGEHDIVRQVESESSLLKTFIKIKYNKATYIGKPYCCNCFKKFEIADIKETQENK